MGTLATILFGLLLSLWPTFDRSPVSVESRLPSEAQIKHADGTVTTATGYIARPIRDLHPGMRVMAESPDGNVDQLEELRYSNEGDLFHTSYPSSGLGTPVLETPLRRVLLD